MANDVSVWVKPPYCSFDGRSFPIPCQRLFDISYEIRYDPDPSKSACLVACSVIEAFNHLVTCTAKDREHVVRMIRKAMRQNQDSEPKEVGP